MATHPIGSVNLSEVVPEAAEARLGVEEGWELIFEMFGKSKELFASFGGGEACLRAERAAWDEDSPAIAHRPTTIVIRSR